EPGTEGGRTVVAYRSREAAERRAAELEAAARADEWDGSASVEARRWDQGEWPDPEMAYGVSLAEARGRFYAVVEVDRGTRPAAAPPRLFLIERASLTTTDAVVHTIELQLDSRYQPHSESDAGDVRVPEAAFFDPDEAERERDRRAAAAREL